MFGLSVLALVVACAASLGMGRYNLNLGDVVGMLWSTATGQANQANQANQATWSAADYGLLFNVRLPRLVASAVVGAALALAGVTFQGVFRNPLVSPDVLGVSQGASVGAAAAILWAGSVAMVPVAALVGGFGTAVIGLLKFIADPETELPAITYWQMGSLASSRSNDVVLVSCLVVPCMVLLFLLRWRVNVLSLGDAEAQSLGVNLVVTRGVAIFLATLMTAASVCISGTVA